jgi:acylglycerol lipase
MTPEVLTNEEAWALAEPPLLNRVVQAAAPKVDLSASNLPGPLAPVFAAGSQLERVFIFARLRFEDTEPLWRCIQDSLEHSGRYVWVADQLTDAGFAAYAVDLRGHGCSGGRPAYVDRMALLVSDVKRLVELVRERHPELPLFVLAHSLGGLVALEYVIRDKPPLKGLVLSGTGIDVSAVPPAQVFLARSLSSIAPKLSLFAFDSSGVSRDPTVVRAYDEDPLNYRGKVPMRTIGELFASSDRVTPLLGSVTLPVLVLHGGADPVAQPAGSTMIHDRVSSTDKEIKVYDELYHEILNEPEKEEVMSDILAWLTRHSQ